MLNVSKNTHGGIDVYALKGSFDAANASKFRDEVANAISSGRTRVIMDFSGVDFIDSTGLGFLVSLLKTILNKGGQLLLVSLAPMILEVFSMTKLDRVFKICKTEQEALKTMGV